MTDAPFPFELLAPPDPLALPLPPAAHPAPGVRLLRAAVYDVPEGRRPLELDLWLPEDTTAPVPLVVFVHGGAWRLGLRDDMGPRLRRWRPGPFARLAAAGFAVACPDYRLSGENVFPAQLDDLRAALRWLHARRDELGVDTARTVTWGESAGGHLSALLALTGGGDPGSPDGPDGCVIAGSVVWYAPADFGTLGGQVPPGAWDPADPRTFEALLLGAAPAGAPDLVRAASPAAQVTADAPPFLILHGTRDSIVPFAQSEQLAAALHAAGATADLRPVPGADHLWVGLPDAEVEQLFDTSAAFARAVTTAP